MRNFMIIVVALMFSLTLFSSYADTAPHIKKAVEKKKPVAHTPLEAANMEIKQLATRVNLLRDKLAKTTHELNVVNNKLANSKGNIQALKFDNLQCKSVVQTLNENMKKCLAGR